MEILSLSQSILIALFCMSVVFAALIALWAAIRFFSFLISLYEKGQEVSEN